MSRSSISHRHGSIVASVGATSGGTRPLRPVFSGATLGFGLGRAEYTRVRLSYPPRGGPARYGRIEVLCCRARTCRNVRYGTRLSRGGSQPQVWAAPHAGRRPRRTSGPRGPWGCHALEARRLSDSLLSKRPLSRQPFPSFRPDGRPRAAADLARHHPRGVRSPEPLCDARDQSRLWPAQPSPKRLPAFLHDG